MKDIENLSPAELVAYWNALQLKQALSGSAGIAKHHPPIVSQLLTELGIPHSPGGITIKIRLN